MRRRAFAAVLTSALLAAASAFAAGPERGTFGPFDRSLNVKAYGYGVVPDPTGGAPTPSVERFEVRPGDCAAETRWDDCAQDRERSELSEKGGRNPAGTYAWYGWSFYVAADFPNVYPTKTVLGQFHQENAHPIWMIEHTPTGLVLEDHVTGPHVRATPLIDEADLRGRWHKVEVEARWSKGADGLIRVWVDGVRKIDHAGPTMDAAKVYFKYGVYRSFMTRYEKANGVDVVPAQVAYYANVRRAADRDGLAPPK